MQPVPFTYGLTGMVRPWKNFVASLGVRPVFLHRNEFRREFPQDTLVLAKRTRAAPSVPHRWESEYALGLIVGDEAVAFPFAELQRSPLAHATISTQPLLVVYVEPAATAVAFRRQVSGRLLTFQALTPEHGGWRMVDRETGTRWNAVTGEAVSGPLTGDQLRPVPATQAYLASWQALYPRGRLWRAPRRSVMRNREAADGRRRLPTAPRAGLTG